MITIRVIAKKDDALKHATKLASMYQVEGKIVRKYVSTDMPDVIPQDADIVIIAVLTEASS